VFFTVTSEFVRAFEATGVSADIASPNANLLEIAPHYVGIELGQLSHEKQVFCRTDYVLTLLFIG
jgi:hypothetical protein